MRSLVDRRMVASFACGAGLAAICLTVVLLRHTRDQSRLVWLELLKREVRSAQHLHAGRSGELAAVTVRGLPGVAQSVASFGLDDATRPALRSARAFYQDAGIPVPAELRPVFASLD